MRRYVYVYEHVIAFFGIRIHAHIHVWIHIHTYTHVCICAHVHGIMSSSQQELRCVYVCPYHVWSSGLWFYFSPHFFHPPVSLYHLSIYLYNAYMHTLICLCVRKTGLRLASSSSGPSAAAGRRPSGLSFRAYGSRDGKWRGCSCSHWFDSQLSPELFRHHYSNKP